MITKVNIVSDVFVRLEEALSTDDRFKVYTYKLKSSAIGLRPYKVRVSRPIVSIFRGTRYMPEKRKMAVSLEVPETYDIPEGYETVSRTVPDALFDVLGIFPRAESGKYSEIIADIKENIGKILAYGGNPTPSWLRESLVRIEGLLGSLEKA